MMCITKSAGLILASAAFLAAQSDPPGRIGRLNYMEGSVSFQPTGVNDWIDASVNRPLTTDDNIWVGTRGRAEFHVGSTALRLGANTSFQFLNLDDDTVQIRLSEGTLTARVRNLPRDQVFEIDTPNLAFTLMRPGEYRIDVNPDNQTTIVTVRDGEGEVTGGGEAFPLYARQRVVVRGDDQISYNLGAPLGLDEWDQWSTSRDRREDQSPSARYVSREIAGYDDLDQYGRWGDQPGYGNVWMPNSVAVGWAPYHDGHWAWISPWGWTWVDEAPWGFAPYHYGRWASFNGRWGWIPGPYGVTPVYAPALVGWVGGGRGGSGFSLSFSIGTVAAVGWFPLGPREPYFPSYQSSQGYFTRVNNTNTVINNVTINNYYANRNSDNAAVTYANRSVQNAVIAVPQETFARGRRVNQDARSVSAAQLTSVRVMAAPAIAPQRESVLGARADTASRAARPPANVISRPVVARTAPPPAPVSFDRQQPALTQNPGRPLAPADVRGKGQGGQGQGQGQSPQVRVMDLGRVRRVQPTADGTPQGAVDRQKGGGQQQPQTQVPQGAVDRQNGPPGRQQRQDPPAQIQQPQAPEVDRQKGRQQRQDPPAQIQQPQAPEVDRQKGRQQRQDPPAQIQQPQAPEVDRQKGRQQRQDPPAQIQQPQAPEVDRQKGRQQQPQTQAPPAQVQPPQAPEVDRQKGRQRQDPPPAAPAVVPVAPPQSQAPAAAPPAAAPPAAAPPAAEKPQPEAAPDNGKQRQDKGKGKSKQDDNQKKSDR